MLRVVGGGKQDWQTPDWLFDALDRVFHFQLDAAASSQNAKCRKYYTIQSNGLTSPWSKRTFCNPPYADISPWIRKAIDEASFGNESVLLLPLLGMCAEWYRENKQFAHTTILAPRIAFVGKAKNPNGGSIVMCFGFPYSNGGLSFLDVSALRPRRAA